MQIEISHSGISKAFANNIFVAVEFQNRMTDKCRAAIKGLPKQVIKVKTIYGTVEPVKIFTFSTFRQMNLFINEKD